MQVKTKSIDGPEELSSFKKLPDECPACHHRISPMQFFSHGARGGSKSHKRMQLALLCPNRTCQKLFIASYAFDEPSKSYVLQSTDPQSPQEPKQPEMVAKLSPTFVDVYKQAAHAQAIGLDQIAGIGYRKSVEFLIKDFAIHEHPTEEGDIKKKFLGKCINEYIRDSSVQAMAKRATWLGNDEAHYVREWSDKDIEDLKTLIRLVTNSIDNILLIEHYKGDMPEQ